MTLRNKIVTILIFIFLLSNIFGKEVWEKEIPPSRYLENFVIKMEKENKKRLEYASYFLLILGAAGISNKDFSYEAEIMGTICLISGGIGFIIDKLREKKSLDKPRTKVGKEYKKIKKIQDENQKEMASYEALVQLANDSSLALDKKGTNNRQGQYENLTRDEHTKNIVSGFMSDLIKNKLKKEDKLKTKEEKLLDNYLNQVPIN